MLAELGTVSPNTWVEVNLTAHVTGDGTYSFRISDSVDREEKTAAKLRLSPSYTTTDCSLITCSQKGIT
jgi:hypothetical protein